MNENLATMIKDHDEETPELQDQNLDVTQEETVSQAETTEETEGQVTEEQYEINCTMLNTWFEQNHNNFDNVNHVQVSIRGINPEETVIFSVLDPKGGEDNQGNPKRELQVWKDADTFPVLDLPGQAMEVHNNGLKILYPYGEGTFIQCYGVRTGLTLVYCVQVGDQLLPYSIGKVKKKDAGVNMVSAPDVAAIQAKLGTNVNMEELQLQYKQVAKHSEEVTTVQDAVNWILQRQTEVFDVNHLLQLDKILVWLVTS